MKTQSSLRSFRQLSYRFMQKEERQHLVTECWLFILITIISGWSLLNIFDTMLPRLGGQAPLPVSNTSNSLYITFHSLTARHLGGFSVTQLTKSHREITNRHNKVTSSLLAQSRVDMERVSMQAKLPLNGTIQHPDLAEALRGDNGTFFCQQGGQGYIVTAAEGYSIKSLRPVGRKVVEQPTVSLVGPEPWTIQKISNEVLEFAETTTRGGSAQARS
jgi:hypothetical protein